MALVRFCGKGDPMVFSFCGDEFYRDSSLVMVNVVACFFVGSSLYFGMFFKVRFPFDVIGEIV